MMMNCDDQRAVLQAELERINAENQRLKEMLNQVTSNYQALQMHFTTLIQNQKAGDAGDPMDEKAGGGGGGGQEKVRHGGGGGNNNSNKLVPRQFMDLGLATNTDTDEPSMSSSEGRSGERSRSPGTTGEVASSKRHSPDQGSNWGSSKVPKFSSSSSSSGKDVDQTEATMRKARVSVRARSEAPMVPISTFFFFSSF